MAHDFMNSFHGVRAAENEKQDTGTLMVLFASEIFQYIIANQFLRSAVARIGFGYNCVHVALG